MRTITFEIEDDESIIPQIVKTAKLPILIAAFCESYGYKETIETVETVIQKTPKIVVTENAEGMMVSTVTEIDEEVQRTVSVPNPISRTDFAKKKYAELGVNFVESYLEMKAREAKITIKDEIIVK